MQTIPEIQLDAMGKVLTSLIVINRIDQALAEDGRLPLDQVRSTTLDNVLVDTGATTLCLPADVIAQLGLKMLMESYEESNFILTRAIALPSTDSMSELFTSTRGLISFTSGAIALPSTASTSRNGIQAYSS
jgi:hypothetical protein